MEVLNCQFGNINFCRLESDASERTDFDSATPGRCRTPDSMFSAISGYMSMGGSSNNSHYKMPEKLQIVKPLEGMLTLCMLGNFAYFLSSADFFQNYLFKKFFQEYYQNVKQFGLCSGPTICWA